MINNPAKIEEESFKIIEKELGEITIPVEYQPTIYRIIHTSADFEYAKITKISKHAISNGLNALKKGCKLYCDTKMILAGINKTALATLKCEAYTLISEKKVADEARDRGITRSIVAMEKALQDPETRIFVIGNAPTALFTLLNAIENGYPQPELIIGVPVGFVGAAESKEELEEKGNNFILTKGRKGGSTIAAAIINSLLYQIYKR